MKNMSRSIGGPSRLAMLGCAATVAIVAMLVSAPPAAAQCKTESGRECTGTEEMMHCLDNSVDAYNECKEDASGFLENAYCFGKYELDFYMCVPRALK